MLNPNKQVTPDEAVLRVREALDGGVLKILSKMGISALASYHGAQTFEIVGLAEDVVALSFKGTPSRLGGLSLDDIDRETASFVKAATNAGDEAIKVCALD